MTYSEMTELVGKTIKEIRLDAEEQHFIQFICTDGSSIIYEAVGD